MDNQVSKEDVKPVISSTTENVLYALTTLIGFVIFFCFGLYVLHQAKKGNLIFNDPYQAFFTMLMIALAITMLIKKYYDFRFNKNLDGLSEAIRNSYFLLTLEVIQTFAMSSSLSLMVILFFTAGSAK